MERKTRNTVILAVVLAVLLAGGFAVQRLFFSAPGPIAVVQLEGRVLHRLELKKNATLTVPSLDGGHNTLVVEDGAVRVTEADCPDLTCVRTGKAWEEGQIIACLPHRLIIYIEKGEP